MKNKSTRVENISNQTKPNLEGDEWKDKEWSEESYRERFLGLLQQVIIAAVACYCKRTAVESVRKRQTTSKTIAMLTEVQRLSDAKREIEKEKKEREEKEKEDKVKERKKSTSSKKKTV